MCAGKSRSIPPHDRARWDPIKKMDAFFYRPWFHLFYDANARSSFRALSITDMTSLTTSSDVGASLPSVSSNSSVSERKVVRAVQALCVRKYALHFYHALRFLFAFLRPHTRGMSVKGGFIRGRPAKIVIRDIGRRMLLSDTRASIEKAVIARSKECAHEGCIRRPSFNAPDQPTGA